MNIIESEVIEKQSNEIINLYLDKENLESNKIYLESKLSSLNSECITCYYILQNVSQISLECAKRLEQWKLLGANRTLIGQNEQLNQNIKKVNKAVWLNSTKKIGDSNTQISDIGWFFVFIKWVFMFLLAPFLILPWALKDPYKDSYCQNHFELRPIKKERIKRLTIYAICTIIWLIIIISIVKG